MSPHLIRAAQPSDAARLTDLFQHVEAASPVGLEVDIDQVRARLDDPGLDTARHTLLVTDATSHPLAYADARPMGIGPDGAVRIRLTSVIRPEAGQDLLRTVHGWLDEHARQLHEEQGAGRDAMVGTRCGDRDPHRLDLLRQTGFAVVRREIAMSRDLDGPLPPSVPPAGFSIRPFDPEFDEATRQAHNDAYAASTTAVLPDRSSWPRHATGRPGFLPHASFLALADPEQAPVPTDPAQAQPSAGLSDPAERRVAAFLLSLEGTPSAGSPGAGAANSAATAGGDGPEAVLECLGTRAAWQRRGLASALIGRALWTYRSRGYRRAQLRVDNTNLPALDLYLRLGFTDTGAGHSVLTRSLPAVRAAEGSGT